MAGAIDQATAEKLAEQLEQSTKDLNEVRADHRKGQGRVNDLVERYDKLEKVQSERQTEFDKVKGELVALAGDVTQHAEENTNLLAQVRKLSRSLGETGQKQDQAFVLHGRNPLRPTTSLAKSAIFASRQQAVELGYYFMATMQAGKECKAYARRWLKEHAGDLRWLPQIPMSFVQELGESHGEVIKRCLNQGFTSEVIQASSTVVAPGSILTFPQFADTFIRNVEEHGVFRQEALNWPMPTDTMLIPRRIGGITIVWEGEGDSLAETEPSIDLLRLLAKKLGGIHFMSNELREDENAAITLADLIMSEFSLAVAIEEDRIGFNGDGTGGSTPGFAGFFGVLGQARAALASETVDKTISVTGGSGDDLTTEIKKAKLHQMTGAVHTWARPNAKWYAHRTVVSDLNAIETTGGGPVVDFTDPNVKRILSYPVREVEGMPVSPSSASKPVIAFGDLRKSWIFGDKRSPTLETSEHFKFQNDQLAIRMTARIGFLAVQPNGMIVYVTAA